MRKILTGASVMLAAMAVTAGAASADSATTVGLSVGNIEADGGGDADFYGLNAAWNHDFGNGWTVQADGQNDRIDAGFADLGAGYLSIGAGVRNESYALYGFAGLTDLGFSGEQLGVGGQLFLGSFVVDGSYGHVEIGDADVSADLLSVGGTYFFTPNLGLGLDASMGELDLGGADADLTGWGINGEWRFDGSPIALTASYRTDNIDIDGLGDADVDTWLVGVSLNFGTDSAHDQATGGASWDGARNAYQATRLLALF